MNGLTQVVMTTLKRWRARPSRTKHFIYEGAGHAFFNDTREDRYHQPSAELAFKRALAFLRD